jgi:hypothetical protein
MIKVKLVAIFAAVVAVLAVSAAPAFAEFESTNGKASGAGKSGSVVLEGGGATLECVSAEGTGTILKQGAESTKGTVLSLNTTTWKECKAKSSEFKELKPKVKACTLHLTQAAQQKQAKGSVATECTIETTVLFLTCTIHVLPEKEVGNVNFGLEKNELENGQNGNLIIKAEDTGVTTTTKGTCPGVTGSSTGKQKATVTGEGVKWV